MKLTTMIIAGLLASTATIVVAQDRSGDPDARAAAALAAMTPDERIDLLHGPMPSFLPPAKRPADAVIGAGYIKGVPRLGIPALRESDASLGVANLANLRKDDVATALPSGAAMASSWDPDLVERGSAMIGSEARAKGFNVLLAGGVNLVREARGGRNFEYLGEDPLLAGILAGHAIRGVQSNRIISTIKHFALNAQETGRSVVSADIDEAAMRESDLLAFEIAIGIGDPGSVMCGYNLVNGVYACENDFLLNTVLRRDWGYKGWVMSDWGAVHSTAALTKGLDQQSGEQIDGKPYFSTMLRAEIAAGRIPQAAVDRAALRILRTMYARGVVDAPAETGSAIDYEAHARIAQEVAEAGIVLLRNERNLLPIAATAKRIVVIGGHADIGILSGGGSSQVRPVGGPALEVTPKGMSIAASFSKMTYTKSSPLAALRAARPDAEIAFDDGSDPARAAALARTADLTLVFAEQWSSEGDDLPSLALPGNQDALIDAVASANPRTVIVLETGGAVAMPWLAKVGAVVEAWYPGQRGGEAIARILTGAVNPSGRLPITFPASLDQVPNPKLPGIDSPALGKGDKALYGVMADRKPFSAVYPEGSDVGYRWFERRKATPLFAFGHGLSYTSFAYAGLRTTGGTTLKVSFDVRNSGAVAGTEVAQVYARVGESKRLVGWQRIALRPGETRRVTVAADPRILANYDTKRGRWVRTAGTVQVEVGGSAVDVRLSGRARRAAATRKP